MFKNRLFVVVSLLFFVYYLDYSLAATPPVFTQVSSCAEISHPNCVEVSSCQDLTQDNTYYLLTQDISSQRTCLFITGDNTIFDLNGYSLTFGDTPMGSIPNGGFETGDSSNWDFSNAPSASINPTSEIPMEGSYFLKLTNPSPGEEIVSDWAPISVVGRWYVGFALIKDNCDNCSYEMIIERQNSGSPVQVCSNVGTNFYPVPHLDCRFVASTSDNYRIRIRFDSPLNPIIDHIDLRPAYDVGIGLARWARSDEYGFPDYLPVSVGNPLNVNITNGMIVQGQGKSVLAKGIFRYDIFDGPFYLSNTYINMTGKTETAVLKSSSSGSLIYNNVFETAQDFVLDRGSLTGPIHISTNDTYTNNYLEGGQGCVFLEGQGGQRVLNSTFVRDTRVPVATNHYCITGWRQSNVEVAGNTFSPYVGDGVLAAIDSSGSVTGWSIHDNLFDITGKPCNYEYTAEHATSIIRITDYHDNLTMHNHVFNNNMTITSRHYPEYPSCTPNSFGIFLSAVGGNNTYVNNTIRAIRTDLNTQAYAVYGAGHNEDFIGNVLESNHVIAWLSAKYADSKNLVFDSNAIIQGSNPMDFETFRFGSWIHNGTGHEFFNNSFGVGTNTSVVYNDGINSDITYFDHLVSWNLDLLYDDSGPVSGALVEIRDLTNTLVYSGITDANGLVSVVLNEYFESKYSSIVPSRVYHTPHQVTVTDGSVVTIVQVNMTSSRSIVVSPSLGCGTFDANADGLIGTSEAASAINSWYAGIVEVLDLVSVLSDWLDGSCSQ